MLTSAPGITVTVGELQKQSDAVRISRKLKTREEQKVRRQQLTNHPSAPFISSFPPPGISLHDNEVTQPIHSTFQAIALNESGSAPPDCMGDLSETQVCIASNARLKFYAKPTVCNTPLTTSTTSGSTSLGNPQFSIDLDVFFSSVRNNISTTDPQVYYDRLTKRWFIVIINVANKSNRVLIAVSNSSQITAASSFTFYYFIHDQGTSPGDPDYQQFADFPMVGLDKNALYIGNLIFNMNNNSYIGASCYVVRKASILSGGPLVFSAFRQVGKSNSGIFAPNPAYNDDPTATQGYFVGTNAGNFGLLNYLIVNDPGGTPTINTGSFTVPATSNPINQTAKGSDKPLDGGDDRLLNVQVIKNKITGVNSLWTAQNIAVSANGIASSSGAEIRNAMRWYELNVSASALTLKQSGTWYNNTASGAPGYWMGSIAASGQGHALAGASVAGTNETANAIIAGRYNNQTAGQLNNTVYATNFNHTYNVEKDEAEQRWGDYSQTVVDPSDNMTIWTFQQYTNATNSWAERAIQIKAPPPATPIGMTPIICNEQKKSEVVLTGRSENNSGFFDPGNDASGPGYSKRLQVTSTGNVTISNIVFENPTQLRFEINYSSSAPGSNQTLTITNPDCQSVTFGYKLPASCDSQSVTKAIYIFPNPASGNINVIVQNSGGSIRLLDVTGKLMMVRTVSSNFISLPVAGFAKGVYIIEYINGNTKERERILVN